MPDPTKPLKISDIKEFEYRNKMYNDSLAAYNSSVETLKDMWENPDIAGYMPEDFVGEDGKHLNTPKSPFFGKYGLDVNVLDAEEKAEKLGYENNNNIAPVIGLEFLGGIGSVDLYKKPIQPVEYQKPTRPSYQQIPVKTPTVLPVQQAIDDELRTTTIPNITPVAKDRQKFTAAKYLESQGKPSGYVNYGEGEGRKDVYQDGGVKNGDPFDDWWKNNPEVNKWRKEFINDWGYEPSLEGYDYRGAFEAGIVPVPTYEPETDRTRYHWGSIGVDGKKLKPKGHPTEWKSDYMETFGINPDEMGIFKQDAILQLEMEKNKTVPQDNVKVVNIYENGGIRNINNNDIGFLFDREFGIQ